MNDLRREGLLHLTVIYLVWGSTYLAIRVAVGEGGFTPMWMGALRTFVAGAALLAYARLRGEVLTITADQAMALAVRGLLIWSAGNGLVLVAETELPSSVAALVAGTTPVWVAVFAAAIERRLPTGWTMIALAAGLAGVVALAGDPALANVPARPLVAMVFAAMCSAAGAVAHARLPVRAPTPVVAGYEHLFATGGFVTLALARGEVPTMPSGGAWLAFGYLVVFGSIVAFTSFVRASSLLPAEVVSTHAYVNPLVAVVLGWLFLGEGVSARTAVAGVAVLVGVVGVLFGSRGRAEEDSLPVARRSIP
jgi:drug/metabolite transporter (DMT)-like permease